MHTSSMVRSSPYPARLRPLIDVDFLEQLLRIAREPKSGGELLELRLIRSPDVATLDLPHRCRMHEGDASQSRPAKPLSFPEPLNPEHQSAFLLQALSYAKYVVRVCI